MNEYIVEKLERDALIIALREIIRHYDDFVERGLDFWPTYCDIIDDIRFRTWEDGTRISYHEVGFESLPEMEHRGLVKVDRTPNARAKIIGFPDATVDVKPTEKGRALIAEIDALLAGEKRDPHASAH